MAAYFAVLNYTLSLHWVAWWVRFMVGMTAGIALAGPPQVKPVAGYLPAVADNGRGFGRLRSWALFVVWTGWIVGSVVVGVLPYVVVMVIAAMLGSLWVRSLVDPAPWSRGSFRRDNLAERTGRIQGRAARRTGRVAARHGLPRRVPRSTQPARAAARRERNRARRYR